MDFSSSFSSGGNFTRSSSPRTRNIGWEPDAKCRSDAPTSSIRLKKASILAISRSRLQAPVPGYYTGVTNEPSCDWNPRSSLRVENRRRAVPRPLRGARARYGRAGFLYGIMPAVPLYIPVYSANLFEDRRFGRLDLLGYFSRRARRDQCLCAAARDYF